MNEVKKSYIVEQVELIARHWPSGTSSNGSHRVVHRMIRALLPDPKVVLTTLLVVGIILFVQKVAAAPSSTPNTPNSSTTTISYQGRLADSVGNPITGTLGIQFNLYNSN